jgi:3-carboxy-cis,cis-muconate cycloisomerase
MSDAAESLYAPLFGDDGIERCFDARATLQGMLDFEAALARAEAATGVIPAAAAEPIAAAARAEHFDVAALGRAAASAGNLAIPMVKALTSRVAERDPEAARYVHWGATSQDAIDTGLVLQMKAALDILDAKLALLVDALAALARRNASVPIVARTWLQHALPTTLGLKAAGWLSAVARARRRLVNTGREGAVVQFGGAAGTLASLGGRGFDVARALATGLELDLPDIPWHAERDRLADVAAACGILAGTLGKIARDVSLLMQTEVGEAFEPSAPGRGGSSTMAHKRNPVACAVALSAAARAPQLVATMIGAMPQEHERGLGGWHAEWRAFPELIRVVAGALRAMNEAIGGFEIDVKRMRENLDATHGLVFAEAVTMALAEKIGRAQAHTVLETASRRALSGGLSLREVLAEDDAVRAQLGPETLDALFVPEAYLGMAQTFVQRALAEAGT